MALLVAVLLLGYAHADEVIMKNGDRLQGKIVSMESGKLVFETAYAGKVTIAWDQVARLTSEDILEISLPDEETLKETLITIITTPISDWDSQNVPTGSPSLVSITWKIRVEKEPQTTPSSTSIITVSCPRSGISLATAGPNGTSSRIWIYCGPWPVAWVTRSGSPRRRISA
jgi:hypothetical protein